MEAETVLFTISLSSIRTGLQRHERDGWFRYIVTLFAIELTGKKCPWIHAKWWQNIYF